MRKLIKKILKEDFDWTNEIPSVVLGKFDEADVSYDDSDAKIYLGEEGEVTYNLSVDELIDYSYDGYEDWVLSTLISNNGDYYDPYGDDDFMDEDEINYLGGYIDNRQKERLQKIMDYYRSTLGYIGPNTPSTDINDYMDDSFSGLEKPLLSIYRGTYDWDDFTSDSLSAIGAALTSNRWKASGEYYLKTLEDNNVEIESYTYGNVKVTMPFPYKDGYNLSEVLNEIGLSDYSWSDGFYEDWDTSGAEVAIKDSINYMLDHLEKEIDEKTNS